MFIKLMLLSIGLLGIAFLGLGLKILLQKGGEFPEHRVGHNKEMRKRNIHCVKTQQKIIDKQIACKEQNFDIGCAGCAFSE